jgi:hypothetical protein
MESDEVVELLHVGASTAQLRSPCDALYDTHVPAGYTVCRQRPQHTSMACVCPAIQIEMINGSFITGGALIRSLSYLRQVTKHFASQQNNGGHAYFFQQLGESSAEFFTLLVTK